MKRTFIEAELAEQQLELVHPPRQADNGYACLPGDTYRQIPAVY